MKIGKRIHTGRSDGAVYQEALKAFAYLPADQRIAFARYARQLSKAIGRLQKLGAQSGSGATALIRVGALEGAKELFENILATQAEVDIPGLDLENVDALRAGLAERENELRAAGDYERPEVVAHLAQRSIPVVP